MAAATYDLGVLRGNNFRQWAEASGLIYYENIATRVTTFVLPAGFEDTVGDVWMIDPTRNWPQWNNQRTGRARLDDPNRGPAATYLQEPHVVARLSTLQRSPESPEPLYRRFMHGVLVWLFTPSEGFQVLQEEMALDLRPDFAVFKLLARPGGSAYEYDFLVGETKVPGQRFETWEEHLHSVMQNSNNDNRNVYGMLHVGLQVQFYRHEDWRFEMLGGRMHLVDDVQDVINMAGYMKAHPLSLV